MKIQFWGHYVLSISQYDLAKRIFHNSSAILSALPINYHSGVTHTHTHHHSSLSHTLTKVSQNSGHFLKFVWADVRTEGKAKVDEHPLPVKVFVSLLLSVVVCEGEGATQGCLAKRLGSLLLSSYVAGQSQVKCRGFGQTHKTLDIIKCLS